MFVANVHRICLVRSVASSTEYVAILSDPFAQPGRKVPPHWATSRLWDKFNDSGSIAVIVMTGALFYRFESYVRRTLVLVGSEHCIHLSVHMDDGA